MGLDEGVFFLVIELHIFDGVAPVPQGSVSLLVEFAERNVEVHDEAPHLFQIPVQDGIDPLEGGVPFIDVALCQLAQVRAVRVGSARAHYYRVDSVGLRILGELEGVFFGRKDDEIELEH